MKNRLETDASFKILHCTRVFVLQLYCASYFLLKWKKKKESEVVQSCPTLCNPMDYNLPGFSAHGIISARILEWVDISFSWARNRTRVSCISGRWLTNWAVRGVIFIVLQINLNSSVEINLQYDQFFVQYGLASLAFFGYFEYTIFISVQFTGSVLSNTLQPHGL